MARGIHDSRYRWVIDRLVDARKSAGWSQEVVAKRLSKPQQYVSRYETGERRLDALEFLDAAGALEIDGLALLAKAVRKR